MRIAICGDNDISNNCIVRLVREFSFHMSVVIFKKPEALLFALEDGQYFDTVIMNDTFSNSNISGIIAAERLYDQLPQAKVILIVDYSKKTFQELFLHDMNLSGVLIQPIDQKLFFAILEKIERIQVMDAPVLRFQIQSRPYTVPYYNILYVESRGHSITLHTWSENIQIYMTLSKMKEKLSDEFRQVHRSFLVNVRQIQCFQKTGVILKNGDFIPVSRAKYNEVKSLYEI